MAKLGTIGIDIGGTKTLFALFDEKFSVVEEIKVKTQPEKGEKAFTKRLVEHLRKESSASSVRGTAIIRDVEN